MRCFHMAMRLHHLANWWEQEMRKSIEVSLAEADIGSFWTILQDLFGDHFSIDKGKEEKAASVAPSVESHTPSTSMTGTPAEVKLPEGPPTK